VLFLLIGSPLKKVQSASLMELPPEVLKKVLEDLSLGGIESLKQVCRKFYFLYYQFFKIDKKEIELFTFSEKNCYPSFLSYLAFHESKNLKEMFLLFLSPELIEKISANIKKLKILNLNLSQFLFSFNKQS